MARKKQPENVEWIVTGNVVLHGVTTTVHAKTRAEAIEKANNGSYIGGIDLDVGELADFAFTKAEANVDEG